jgi:glycosyltransferase involved in cell wall biosynthesis
MFFQGNQVKSSPKALYIDSDTPRPDHAAGSIEALNFMRILKELGYQVTFVPESNFLRRGKYTTDLHNEGIIAVYHPFCSSVQAALRTDGPYDVVVLCRPNIAYAYIDDVRRLQPSARVIFYTVDLHFLREIREAELLQDDRLRKSAQVTKERELSAVSRADVTVVLSDFEHEFLRKENPDARLTVLPLLRELPHSLECPGFGDRQGIAFIGSYEHAPNRDAATYLVREIWPLIASRLPRDAKLYLVGSPVTKEIARLKSERVDVVGHVPDLRRFLDRCKATVAPLRYGAGLKGKIASSLEAGVPCIATPSAVEGTPIRAGEEILVAEEPKDFSSAVVRVYSDADLWAKLSRQGFEFAKQEYSYESGKRKIRDLLASKVGSELTSSNP